MKSYLKFGLLLILALVPLHSSKAITQTQINALVQVVCPGQNDTWFSGSGTIIDTKGIVLTNKHVVTDQSGNIIKYCAIGLTKNINQPPSFDYSAEVKYYTTDENLDAAILYIDNKNNTPFPSINAFSYDTNNLKLGDGIEVVGYPSIGGNTVTYVNGVMSGVRGDYIKTTAPLEHGNSGGSAYTFDGDFIGIPTAVVSGKLNSISFILDINRIKSWLQSALGGSYSNIIESQRQPRINIKPVLSADVTPPDTSTVVVSVYADWEKNIPLNFEKSYDIDWPYFTWDGFKDDSGIAGYYVYIGKNFNAIPINSGTFTKDKYSIPTFEIKDPGIYYLKIQAKDNHGNISNSVYRTYYYKTSENIGTVDYGQSSSAKSLSSRPTKFYVYSFDTGVKGELLKIVYLNSKEIQRFTLPTNNLYIEWDVKKSDFIVDELVVLTQDWAYKNDDNWEGRCNKMSSEDSVEEYIRCVRKGNGKELAKFGTNYAVYTGMNKNQVYALRYSAFWDNNGKLDYAHHFEVFEVTPTKSVFINERKMKQKLAGFILLQVESHGEAWYVNPKDNKRYYMKDGATTYQIMRNFGLGITNANLVKIPQEDEKNHYASFVNSLKGKILLQVEANGEAWYVNPKTGYRHYIKDGGAAYNLMRYYSLGITNKDLEKIPEGKL
ncbi:MAG: S1C family serine protease [bacterium]|nr:S1C family serine protease [bacterium]